MASPQKENGYTPIANEIMEALARTNLTKYEYKALFLIYRMTYGYQRLTWELDKWNEFEYIGLTKTHIQRTIQSLADKNHIKVDFKNKTITILKDYEKWNAKPIQKVTNSGNFSDGEIDPKVTNSGNKKLPIQVTKVTNSGNLTLFKRNDTNASQDPKERKKIKESSIYNNISTNKEGWKYDGWREHFEIGKKYIEDQNQSFFTSILPKLTDEHFRMITFIGSTGEAGRAAVIAKAGKVKDQINIITWAYQDLSGDGKARDNPFPTPYGTPEQARAEFMAKIAEAQKIKENMKNENKSDT